MKKALFAFKGDPVCFIHVLLNAIDMDEKGIEVRIVMEGAATALIPELVKNGHPFRQLWESVREKGLIAGVCRACAAKMESLEAAEAQGLKILDSMKGHPSMADFIKNGYEIITF